MSSDTEFRAVGIDFGTSTSLVARRSGLGRVEVLPLGGGRTTFPSSASIHDGSFIVGEAAEERPPDLVIRSVKRAITHKHSTVRVGGSAGTDVDADNVIVAVLSEVVTRARDRNVDLRSEPLVRLGCPAAWDRQQRDRILRLAKRAGIPVGYDTLVDEPVAAGIAWLTARYLASPEKVEGRLLVFDMGGGTLDIAVLGVEGGARPKVSVLSSSGSPWAGDALDQQIADTLLDKLGLDLAEVPAPNRAAAALLIESRRAKERLSQRDTHPVVLPRMFFGSTPTLRLSRAEVEEQFEPQMRDAEQLIWHQLRMARLTHTHGEHTEEIMRAQPDDLAWDITHVLLAGGMSHMPYLRRRLRKLFPHASVFDNPDGIEPDEAIVAGLADTVGYDQLSMHRPGFDVTLEWRHGRKRQVTLYEAYTPLYDKSDIDNRSFLLGHATRPERSLFPQWQSGTLWTRTPAGEPVTLVSAQGERHVKGVPIRFGSHQIVFKLYADGRIHLTDGAGFVHRLRPDGWEPVIGRVYVPEPRPDPDLPAVYPFNRDD